MIEYFLIEFNIKISKLEDEIKQLKNETNELKEKINKLSNQLYNRCFVYTDEEHNQSESEESGSDSNHNSEHLNCGCGKEPNKSCPIIEEYINNLRL
jgi:chromosome segregation ATPase